MKFDLKGIRFNIWLYFFVFSAAILLLFGVLLNFLIRPYYRNDRLERMDNLSNILESQLLSDGTTPADLETINTILVNSNVCALIYNENADRLFYSDTLGQNCIFRESITIGSDTLSINAQPQGALSYLKENDHLSYTFVSPNNGSEMLLYGESIRKDLVNYYLFINSPLEPVESIIDFIMEQYVYIALIVTGIAVLASIALSNRIAAPIVRMKKEANKLANGDYDVDFGSNSYTEIDDLALTLDDASDKLSRISELRKDLIANVSHDIKTPLTMIQAYAEMIRDISGDDPQKRNEHIDVILKESDYLNRLVSDMQELSKMEAGYIELTPVNFDLQDAAEDVTELLEHLMQEKEITLVKELVPVTVYADEVKISQVIYNFLVNAIKHSPSGTLITIRIKDSEEKVRLEVEDHGSGIAEKDLPYIWDRYYKIDKGFRRNQESSGLGLAIVKAILEAHKASYGVESKLGEGSLFYFELSKDYDE
ncbi:MAG: HAMP domain-containing histidine kinase [Erysipelotrichaceae bacterium]|nr:HAMP domain-containing histidine kinase [Erysipelotrichaceae bacterium]